MNCVWVATVGTYDDFQIVGVASSPEKAISMAKAKDLPDPAVYGWIVDDEEDQGAQIDFDNFEI